MATAHFVADAQALPPPYGADPVREPLEVPVRPQDLRIFPILRDLSDQDLAFIMSRLLFEKSFGGQIGARTRVEEVRFSLLLSGQYRVVAISTAGEAVTLRSVGPGDHFGEMGILANRAPGNWALIADRPGDVLYMHHADLTEVLKRVPALAGSLLQPLASQAADWAQRIFELAILSPRARLLAEFLRLAKLRGLTGPRVVLTQAPSHEALASQVGVTREAVSRNMKQLRKEGLVLSGRREIVLTDLPRLKALVNGEID